MRVSLRKANALQEQLNEAIKTRPSADHEVNVIDYELWRSEIEMPRPNTTKKWRSNLKWLKPGSLFVRVLPTIIP